MKVANASIGMDVATLLLMTAMTALMRRIVNFQNVRGGSLGVTVANASQSGDIATMLLMTAMTALMRRIVSINVRRTSLSVTTASVFRRVLRMTATKIVLTVLMSMAELAIVNYYDSDGIWCDQRLFQKSSMPFFIINESKSLKLEQTE